MHDNFYYKDILCHFQALDKNAGLITEVKKFSRNLETTSKFLAPKA
jgi:hypothetical protein